MIAYYLLVFILKKSLQDLQILLRQIIFFILIKRVDFYVIKIQYIDIDKEFFFVTIR